MRNVVIATVITGFAIAGVIGLLIGRRCVHVVPDGEAHVVQRFGRFRTVRKPGVRLRLPVFERVSRVSIRPFGLPLTAVASTRDGRLVRASGVVEFVVADPRRYLVHHAAVKAISASLITSVVSRALVTLDAATTPDGLAGAALPELSRSFRRYGLRVTSIVVRSITPVDRVPAVSIAAA